MDAGLLTLALQTLNAAALGLLAPFGTQAHDLLIAIMSLVYAWTVLVWLVDGRPTLLSHGLRMIILFAVFGYAVAAFPRVAPLIFDMAAETGMMAAAGAPFSMNDPSGVIMRGMEIAGVILGRALQLLSPIDLFTNLVTILGLLLCSLCVLASFLIAAFQVFIISAQFYTLAPVALLTLAFGPWRATAGFAGKGFGFVAGCAIQALVLAAVLGLTAFMIDQVVLDRNLTVAQAFAAALCALLLAYLCWRLPALAAGLVIGGPAIGAVEAFGALARTIATVGSAAAAGAAAAGTGTALRGLAGAMGGGRGAGGEGGGADSGPGPSDSGPPGLHPFRGGSTSVWEGSPSPLQQDQARAKGIAPEGLTAGELSAELEMAGGERSYWPGAEEYITAKRARGQTGGSGGT